MVVDDDDVVVLAASFPPTNRSACARLLAFEAAARNSLSFSLTVGLGLMIGELFLFGGGLLVPLVRPTLPPEVAAALRAALPPPTVSAQMEASVW